MQIVSRLVAIAAIALILPACASKPKKADCCSSHVGKCAAGDSKCHAPTTTKKAN